MHAIERRVVEVVDRLLLERGELDPIDCLVGFGLLRQVAARQSAHHRLRRTAAIGRDVDDPRAVGSYTKSGFSADLTRLVQLKKKHDPTNLFRLNANIIPTA
jgi:hypothetical protein